MEKQLRDRLRELTEEFANGQNLLADLQRRGEKFTRDVTTNQWRYSTARRRAGQNRRQ